MASDLDDVDRGILYLLQLDARNTTAQEMSDEAGVSPSTVRNRIDRLEADGVITGYRPTLDYEAANFPLRVLFVITAPATKRSEAVEEILDIEGIVTVRETLTGRRNLYAEVVGTNTSDVSRTTDAIHELGFEIESSEMVKQCRTQPFEHFHYGGERVGEEREEDG